MKYATWMADYDTAVAEVAASQYTDNPKEIKEGAREAHDYVLGGQRRLDALDADLALHATSARSDWRKKRKVYARRAETARIRRARKRDRMARPMQKASLGALPHSASAPYIFLNRHQNCGTRGTSIWSSELRRS